MFKDKFYGLFSLRTTWVGIFGRGYEKHPSGIPPEESHYRRGRSSPGLKGKNNPTLYFHGLSSNSLELKR